MTIYGDIPKDITYYVRKPHEVTRGWHGIDKLWINDPVIASPAFPVDPKSPSSKNTAKRWAEGWNSADKSRIVESANTPIQEVEVLTIETRAEGGRAYKVRLCGIEDGSLYVDMREDVLLDAMLVNGVKKGGILPGPFVWGRLHSQLRLVRVGSTLHTEMRAAASRKEEKLVGPKEWRVGGVYLTRELRALMYLGEVTVESAAFPSTYRWWEQPLSNLLVTVKHGVGWLELDYFGPFERRRLTDEARRTLQPWMDRWCSSVQDGDHFFPFGPELIKKPRLIQCVGYLPFTWDALRNAAVRYGLTGRPSGIVGDGGLNSDQHRRLTLLDACGLAHVRPLGEARPYHEAYKDIWANAKRKETP